MSERQNSIKDRSKCPLSIWSEETLAHARLTIEEDVRPSYETLLLESDDKVFQGKLARERSLHPSLVNNERSARMLSK